MLEKPAELLERLEQSGLLSPSIIERRDALLGTENAEKAADELVRLNLLTEYQARVAVKDDAVPLSIGDYIVEDMIGRGGMGFVLKARHRRMKRQVAIKFLHKSMTESPDLVARFEREVEAAAQLHHQNIVTAYDAGEHDGSHYLVMQFVDGEDLSHRVKRDGPLRVSEAIDVIRQAAEGLGYAHEKGIVHRDIKPGNLLLDREGVVRILDMGLARMRPSPGDALDGGAHADLTNTGSVMGTVDYMAPEQALDAKTADFSADIYSLGCTLYFLLTSNPPFRSDTIMRRLLAHREQDVPLISHVRPEAPRELDQVFATMMAKKKEDRYPSMRHLIVALNSIELEDSEAEQMATIDAPDDGTGGFLKLPETDDVDDSADFVDTSSFTESSATTPTGSAVVDPGSSATDATLIESDSQLSNTVVVSDADSLAHDESFSAGPSNATSPPESPQRDASRDTSSPPWKIIIPGIAAVLVIAVLFAISQNGTDESETSGPLADAEPQSSSQATASRSGELGEPASSGTAQSDTVAMSPDRRAAEWVVSIGGTVHVTVGQQTVTATSPDQLPNESFFVDTVQLAGNPKVTDEGLKALQGLSRLRSIAAWDTPISDAGLANLTDSGQQPLPNLRSLQLERTQITDTGLGYLTDSPIDKFLALGGTDVSDPDLLRKFSDATNLNIGLTSLPLSRLDFLKDFSRLTALSLDARQWNALAAETPQFAESLLNLSVYIRSNTRVDERLLQKTPHLIGLSMSGPVESQFDEAFWTALAALSDLEELRMDAEISDEALTHVQRMPQLHTLHLDSTTITGQGFANAAQQLPALQTLNLTNGSLTDNDVPSLATLRTPQQFVVRGNQITADGIASLRRALLGCRIISDHGTFEPTASQASNWALNFDGVDDFVECPTLTIDPNRPFAIEATVRNWEDRYGVVCGWMGNVALRVAKGNLLGAGITTTELPEGDSHKLGTEIPDTDVLRLALTSDGKQVRLFVNGVEKTSRTNDHPISPIELRSGRFFCVGAHNFRRPSGLFGAFSGTIDEVRVSSTQRYSEQYIPAERLEADEHTVALYHFDQGRGSVLKDSSGNGHDGVIHGATWIEQVVPSVVQAQRYALSFDGQDDYVELPLAYDGSHPATIELWVRPTAFGNHTNVIGNRDGLTKGLTLKIDTRDGHNRWAFLGNRSSDGAYVGVDGREQAAGGSDVHLNEWVHLAATWDGRRPRLFVNGEPFADVFVKDQKVAADAAVQLTPSDASFVIGGAMNPLHGDVRAIRISRHVRYARQFTPPLTLNPDEQTLAAYDFALGQGELLRDRSGNGHDGTIYGATWIERGSDSEKQNSFALNFDGVDDFVEIPSLQHEPGSPITIEATVSDWGDEYGFICGWRACAGLAASRNVLVGSFGTTDLKNDLDHKIGKEISGPRKVQVALVYDGTEGRLFSNGKLLGTRKLEHPLKPSSNRWSKGFAIGAASERSADGFMVPVKALIDEVRVSRTARYDANYVPEPVLQDDEHTVALFHFDSGQGAVLRDSSGNRHDGTIHGATWERIGSPAAADSDAQRNRRAAEWILKHDGNVIVRSISTGGDKGVKAGETLPETPFHLVQINLNKLAPENEFAHLAGLTELEGAFINYFPLTDAALTHLKDSTKLRSLHLEGTQISTEGLDVLLHFPALESLQLPAGQTDAIVPKLLSAKRLKRLGVGFKSERVANLSQLSELKQLESLRLLYLDVTADSSEPGSLQFLQQLPNLTSFDLGRCKVSTQCLSGLAKLNRLRDLSFRDNFIEPDTLKELEQFQHLDSLTVTGVDLTDASIELFEKLTNLKSLNVENNKLSPEGIATLRKSLPACRIVSDHGRFKATAPKPDPSSAASGGTKSSSRRQ